MIHDFQVLDKLFKKDYKVFMRPRIYNRKTELQKDFDKHFAHKQLLPEDVAKDLGITVDGLLTWVEEKRIKAVYDSDGNVRFKMSDVQDFLLNDEFC